MTQIGQRSLDSPITPIAVFFRHARHQIRSPPIFSVGRIPVAGAIILLRDQPASQGSRISGVTIVAASRRSLIPDPFALSANRQRR